MWKKIITIIVLFYFLTLIQSSFLAQFNFFGTTHRLVFTLFFLLIFFTKEDKKNQIIFFSLVAGLFLDLFSYSYLGIFIAIFLAIGFLIKKMQSMLQGTESKESFIYFLPLFIISLLFFDLLVSLALYFFDINKVMLLFDIKIVFYIIYNSLFASLFYFIYKKWLKYTK